MHSVNSWLESLSKILYWCQMAFWVVFEDYDFEEDKFFLWATALVWYLHGDLEALVSWQEVNGTPSFLHGQTNNGIIAINNENWTVWQELVFWGNLNWIQSDQFVCRECQKAATYRTRGTSDACGLRLHFKNYQVPSRDAHIQSWTGWKNMLNLSRLLKKWVLGWLETWHTSIF